MKKSLLCGLAATLALSASAQASDYFHESSMIELGAGVSASTEGPGPIEALISVEALGIHQTGYESAFVLARIKTEMTGGVGGVPYVDIELESLGYQFGLGDDFVRATFLNMEFQRNVAIGNEATFRLSLVGVRGQLEEKLSPEVKFLVNGALDLLGIAYTKRSTDGADLFGSGFGLEGEIGVELYERFRITLGGELNATLGKPERVWVGYSCDTYHDRWGSHTYCSDDYATQWNDVRLNGEVSLNLQASLTKNLAIFGKASYNVYSVQDSTAETVPSSDGEFRFVLGATYQF